MRLRAAVVFALLALGCGVPRTSGGWAPDSGRAPSVPTDPPPTPEADAAPADAPAPGPDRSAAAGLAPADAARLVALDAPLAVPGRLPEGWRVARVTTSAGDGDAFAPEYAIHYAGPDGACLAVVGASEGLGDRLLTPPPAVREIAAPALPTFGPVVLAWADGAGEHDGPWGRPRLTTEWTGTDGVAYAVESPSGAACARAEVDDAAQLAASLRMLDARDDGPVGPWRWVDAPSASAGSPEAVARLVAGPAPDARETIDVLQRRARHAVVIVTHTGLADDSVRDVRWRIATVHSGGTWEAVAVGQQVRCQAGRGATDWTDALCL